MILYVPRHVVRVNKYLILSDTVPPSSDHYGTTKVAPPSDHLHTKRTQQRKLFGEKNIQEKFFGGHGPRGPPLATLPSSGVAIFNWSGFFVWIGMVKNVLSRVTW